MVIGKFSIWAISYTGPIAIESILSDLDPAFKDTFIEV